VTALYQNPPQAARTGAPFAETASSPQTTRRAFDGGLWFDNLEDRSRVAVHVGLDEAGGEGITFCFDSLSAKNGEFR